MSYQLTCVCGNRFFITEQQLSGHVTCPSCGRPLIPVLSPQQPAAPAGAPAAGGAEPDPAVATSAEPTKRCPFCGEVILAIARKCKHCGEFLDRAAPESPGTAAAAPLRPAASQSPAPPSPAPRPPAPAAPSGSAAPAAGADDPPVFALSVSQWDNFWKYVICLTIAAGVIVLLIKVPMLQQYARIGIPVTAIAMGLIAWFFYLATRNARCIIRPLRIETEVGVFSKDINTLEIFRITDLELKQGIVERLLRIGTIRVSSSDPNTPELFLYQIPKARKVYKYLQQQVPQAVKQRGAMYIEH